ncbi:hypothetical protein [Acidicapsa acidisoli]|uniref:hypothetical protein n=1 Tax=Acidicapsa acidisoli TaxID=1615681 RepID=UPI0021DF66C8|nr:hypothetical protein [Acidicapsa acidisoli]
MNTLTVSLVRFSPAWCIFVLGFCAVAAALFALCFIGGEALAMNLLAHGGAQ